MLEDQRARLHGAIAEAVSRHGYKDAHVDEIVALAGVSTSTLYNIYGGKLGCFLGAYDAFVDQTAQQVTSAYCLASAARGEPVGLHAGVRQLLDRLSQHPAAARLVLVEAPAVGAPTRACVERGEARFAGTIEQGLTRQVEGTRLPLRLVTGILHGIWSLARRTLLEGREDEIAKAAEELTAWLRCYPHPGLERLVSGPRAQQLAVGVRPVRSNAPDERTQILDATARLAARAGYQRLSLGRIADEAGVSRRHLAALFDSVDACLLAAAEALSVRALARAYELARGERDWPRAVCIVVGSLYAQAASNPVFARVCFAEILHTGPASAPRRGALLTGFARLLATRAPQGHVPPPIVAELVAGGVWGIAHHAVIRGNVQSLPAASGCAAYLTLAPVIGPAEAVRAVAAWQAPGAGA